eukprot:1258040-Ditylum_brightwellii.AAC.1
MKERRIRCRESATDTARGAKGIRGSAGTGLLQWSQKTVAQAPVTAVEIASKAKCRRHQRNKKNCSSSRRHHSQARHQKSSSGHGPTSHHQ